MYYIANTAEAQLKHIAIEDMIVYQVGELYKNKCFLSCFNTIYIENGSLGRKQFIPHILCKSITLNFDGNGKYPVKSINKGYFSFEKIEFLKKISVGYNNEPSIAIVSNDYPLGFYAINIYKNLIIGKFLIPKGTIYYENTNGEIVSSQIMFTGIIHKPIIYDDSVKSVKINLNEEDRAVSTEASK